ncbi:universal stress protein [Agriterribacter sp.]|uniref:universal stress protein n=1 Tax=Agriterribacter sp. TaxID=2821509 RepID=UPI002B6BED69|nr:universal stress protein [Agriterribacter sp.]HRO47378.1 universal stress protein [Agriterribacter sp.]HRQ18799.1 universal stress protein [Agriterribacter sp.]
MKKILVPTDFSSCAVNALNFAVQTAKFCAVEINLLHVVDRTDSLYSERPDLIQEKYSAVLEEAQEKLDQVKASIAETELVEIRTFLREGEVDEHILQLSEEKGVDLIVMGTFGINGLKDRIWGSKTAGLTGKTSVPVMVIPYEYNWKVPGKILLATSFFEEDRDVLEPITGLTDAFKTTLHAVIFTDEDTADAALFLEHGMNMADYERKLKKQLNTESVVTNHLSGRKFEDTLQDYIKEQDIDILAMITYQRSLWDRIFHPSVTRRMSYHTTIPLLVIPANRKGEE